MMKYFKNDCELEWRCELIVYLHTEGELESLRKEMIEYGEVLKKYEYNFPPFRYYFQISVIDLFNKSDLGNVLVNEPAAFSRMLRDIIMACVKREGLSVRVLPEQIHTPIRFLTFPSILVPAGQHFHKGLICVRGVIISKSVPSSYIYHSVWKCPEECVNNEIVICGVPRTTLRCQTCKSVLNEMRGLRRCGEKLYVTVGGPGVISRNVTVADELTDNIELGHEYTIYGIIKHNTIHAWSMDQNPAYTNQYWETSMPNSIEKIVKGKGNWKKIYKMASLIGNDVCPEYAFMHVKLGLLLSLASLPVRNGKSDDTLHVFIAGIDSQYVSRLLKAAAALASSYVMLSNGNANNSVPEALVSCSTSVCVLPSPWYTYHGNTTHALRSALESGEFSIATNKVKVRCAVWAHGQNTKKCNINDISSVFGMVYRGDFNDNTDKLINFMPDQACQVSGRLQENKSRRDLKVYLEKIQGMKVVLEKEAEELLKNYFLATRKISPGAVSIHCLSTLINLSKSIARLHTRQVATCADAVCAIWMHAVGMPEPRNIPDEFAETPENIHEIEHKMSEYSMWLEGFIDSTMVNT